MKFIVDTNIPLTANGAAPQASAYCANRCMHKLQDICAQHVLVLDKNGYIIGEYKHRLNSSGEPGAGDAFLKWVLTNVADPRRCEVVSLTPKTTGQEGRDFEEFPQDEDLAHFDPSDRKFVAVAITHPEHPPILNAMDSDWWEYREVLLQHGVQVEFVCPDAPFIRQD